MTEIRIANAEPWKEGICGCCNDQATCCYGFFCPCCLFGDNVKHTSKEAGCVGGCCGYLLLCVGCCCLIHKPARVRFREAYGLQEGHGLGSDSCASRCCSCCGNCQEAREIKTRGPPPMITVVGHPGLAPSTIGTQPGSTVLVAGVRTAQP